jgi:hypothetical protein
MGLAKCGIPSREIRYRKGRDGIAQLTAGLAPWYNHRATLEHGRRTAPFARDGGQNLWSWQLQCINSVRCIKEDRSMKRVVFLTVAALMAASLVFAQGGSIGLFADPRARTVTSPITSRAW